MLETSPIPHTKRLQLAEIKQEQPGDIFTLFRDQRVSRLYNLIILAEEHEAQKLIDWFQQVFYRKRRNSPGHLTEG